MECIRDVGPHVVGQISLSEDFPDGHVLKRGNDLAAGEAASEFFLHVPVDDQRQIAGEEVSFDVVFQADVSWSCLELGLHDAEAFFDLPSLVIHPDDVFGGILQIVGNRIESIIHLFFRDPLCVQGALDDFRDLSIFGDGGLLDEPAEVLLVLLSSFGVAAVDGPLCPVDLALTDVALILLVLQGESDDQGLFEVASVYEAFFVECLVIVFDQIQFSEVIEPFVREYELGNTPNPCIECNRCMKFYHLFKKMEELGCELVVTGHYARISKDEKTGRYLLMKAKDLSKDQSYVLYSMNQYQLAHVMFPLGDMDKTLTRELAGKQGFRNADKHDSQDICFVPDGDYVAFMERYRNKKYPEGDFIDKEGNVIGRHKGYVHYTIGQRRGLGIAAEHPLYVVDINPKTNTVTLGKNEDLFKTELVADRINLISVPRIDGQMRIKAKIRYRHTEQPATVIQLDEDTIKVVFDEPQRAITRGQAVVLYDGDIVVGGGTII